MKDEIWWNLFCDTGDTNAYLIYKSNQGEVKGAADKNDRPGHKGDTSGRLQ